MPPDLTLKAIAGFRLVTADPARLVAFYRALGFGAGPAAPIPEAEMRALGLDGGGSRTPLSLGASRIDLDCYDRTGRPFPADASACDLDFQHFALVTDDAQAAWRRAREAGAAAISEGGPVTLPPSSGGVTAVKFRDPEGHPLEFLQFPPNARPDWSGSGIMGIDHSAISVRDVEASKRFYTDLGLTVGDATLNHGPAQAALDGLGGRSGVEVDVVPMKPADAPPHLELLGYRRPAARVTPPPDPRDIAATRILWWADGEGLLRDPDGHLHQLTRRGRSPEGSVPP